MYHDIPLMVILNKSMVTSTPATNQFLSMKYIVYCHKLFGKRCNISCFSPAVKSVQWNIQQRKLHVHFLCRHFFAAAGNAWYLTLYFL